MEIEFIRTKLRCKEYVIDADHLVMLRKYGITIHDIEQAILTGEIIETYPGDLILGEIPLHIACSYWAEKELLYIRTVYIPDDRWEPDFRTRKKRK
jgi:hypothetical protein